MQINVIEYFEKGALLKCKDKVAIKDQSGEYTFGQLGCYAKNLAALILKKTSARNQPIPVFLPKSAGNIVANVGILYSANAYANLDVKSPPQRLKGMLDNLNPNVILTTAGHTDALRALGFNDEKFVL